MKTEWIKDLLAVIETGSIAKAAYVRSVSQPAFSRRIQTIEEHVGKELIDRTVKPARPKSELLAMHQEMNDIARKIGLLQGALLQTIHHEKVVVLAAQHATAVTLGTRIIEQFNRLETMRVNLCSENHDQCLVLLMRQQADIGIIYVAPDEEDKYIKYPSILESTKISVDQLIPVCSAAQSAQIHAAIHGRVLPIINYPSESFLGGIMEKHILSQLFNIGDIHILAETALTLAAKNLALAGVGVAWLPQPLVEQEIQRQELVDMSNLLPVVSLPLIACRAIQATEHTLEAWSILLSVVQQSDTT